jgi:hypothetical protein
MKKQQIVVLALAVSSAAEATKVEVATYWLPEGESRFSFHSGNLELCSFAGRAPAGSASTTGVCRFELPPGASTLTVRGSATQLVWSSGKSALKSANGEMTLPLVDAAPMMAPLRDRRLSVAERWKRARAGDAALAGSYGGVALIEARGAATPSDITAAERRLGFTLPASYRDLATAVGGLELSDHFVPAPPDLSTADRTILVSWGYGAEGTPKVVSPRALERLKRSVLLFFEVGDGMGAQLFLAPPNAACGAQFATLYLHEESLAEAMASLAKDDLSCTPFDETLLENVESFLVLEHEQALMDESGKLLVDSSAPLQKFNLRYTVTARGELDLDLSRE